MNAEEKQKVIIYEDSDQGMEILLDDSKDTIWLTQVQLAELFDKSVKTISEHIQNILKSDELQFDRTVRKFRLVQKEGNREVSREIDHYNLDMIISVGYRVNSKKATKFRQWATRTLKQYLVNGYVINEKKILGEHGPDINHLLGVIELIRTKIDLPVFEGKEKELLALIEDYAVSWNLFHKFDEGNLDTHEFEHKVKYHIEYEEIKKTIQSFQNHLSDIGEANDLFGHEVENKLKSIVGTINQSFSENQIYPSVEEKAANLLYLIIKDHPFVDGNKRIGSMLFVYFLQKNDFIWKVNKEKKINDNALVALALLVASSDPKDKDTMIKLIIKLVQNDYVGKTKS